MDGEIRDILAGIVDVIAEDAPPRTAHEVVELPPIEPVETLVVAEGPLFHVGGVSTCLDDGQLVVRGLENGKALVEGIVLCLGDRSPLGRIWEVFGPVRHPHYVVRTSSAASLDLGTLVFAPQTEAAFVDAEYVSKLRGTDASNDHDEELQDDTDDETTGLLDEDGFLVEDDDHHER
ncbi:hypothetical protein CTAYLR_008886 [Chrysophaeum taylorii]|uniref:H/ACA ribonucleoprotein complex subunit n=1 Tax=Chrysophaeum taylorii TaxID=2483200 RepID=A0AAD7UJP2_9STRA|nr:hypothetical protein CTAYLR_008886 [Chrysophaeum taylorii]